MRIVFAVVGTLAALLAVGTVVMALVFYTATASPRALWGSLLYFGIAVACFYAFFRMRRAPNPRGFNVVERARER